VVDENEEPAVIVTAYRTDYDAGGNMVGFEILDG